MPVDCIEGPEAAEIRAEVLTLAGKLESLNYWLDCIAAPDEKTFIAPTLTKAEVRFSLRDEFILLRLDTANEQTWWRLTRENFIGLAAYLGAESRRLEQ